MLRECSPAPGSERGQIWLTEVSQKMSSTPSIRIEHPHYGGSFSSDRSTLIPFVLPGELVSTTETPLQILEPSPDRVEPRCIHFGECGGCHYQHAAYPAQLALKAEILGGILAQAGLEDLPPIRTNSASEWGYRNRIRLRMERTAEGFQAGYSRRASNEFLPIRMCPIAAPLLWRAMGVLIVLAASDSLIARWLAAVSEVELFCTADESRLQLRFLLREAEAARREPGIFGSVCERIRAQLPELAGAGAELDPDLNRRVRRRWQGAEWGSAGINYKVAGRAYWVSRGAFFQVNRFLVDRLVELVCADASGDLAWDLFAGVGLFSRVLAETFKRVIAVEAADAAAADLAAAAKGARDRPAFEAVHSPTLDFLRLHGLQRERPDLIVLDPPRAGLGAEAAALLAGIPSPRLVYVSCDPTTLARDLAILTRASFRIDAIDLIDLFPQTFHIETVVHLSHR
jgi:23S rRNA (uracil1939-C5)-methyltransferase